MEAESRAYPVPTNPFGRIVDRAHVWEDNHPYLAACIGVVVVIILALLVLFALCVLNPADARGGEAVASVMDTLAIANLEESCRSLENIRTQIEADATKLRAQGTPDIELEFLASEISSINRITRECVRLLRQGNRTEGMALLKEAEERWDGISGDILKVSSREEEGGG